MAKTTKPAPRPKRTKAETEQEFTEIQEEVTAAREALEPKAEEVRKARETETRAAVEGLSVETVVGEISNLGLEVSKSLAALSDQARAGSQSLGDSSRGRHARTKRIGAVA